MKTKLKVLLALTSLACLTAVQGQTVITPIGEGINSEIDLFRTGDKTIDGSGLSGVGDILTQTHALLDNTTAIYWLSANTSSNLNSVVATYRLTLGTDPGVAVNAVHLWNYDHESGGAILDRAIASFDITFSKDNGATYEAYGVGRVTGVAKGDGVGTIAAQTFTFAAVEDVQLVRITNIANHGDANYVGLSEVRFGAIPEPSAFALIAGFLGFTWVMLRRRRA